MWATPLTLRPITWREPFQAASPGSATSGRSPPTPPYWVCALDQLTAVITNDEEDPGALAGLAAGAALLRAGRAGQPSLTAAR
jgi:hypothetical protein